MSALSCGICVNDYGGMVVPMHLSCCQNHICFDCAEKDRARQIGELIGNKKQIKCIYCNRLFHSSKETPWSVNKTLIEVANMTVDLSGVRAAQGTIMPMQSSVVTLRSGSSTTRRRTRAMAAETNHEPADTDTATNDPLSSSTTSHPRVQEEPEGVAVSDRQGQEITTELLIPQATIVTPH